MMTCVNEKGLGHVPKTNHRGHSNISLGNRRELKAKKGFDYCLAYKQEFRRGTLRAFMWAKKIQTALFAE